VDRIGVRAGLAVQVEGVATNRYTVIRRSQRPRRRQRLQLVDDECVLAVAYRRSGSHGSGRIAAVGECLAAEEGLLKRERIVVDIAEESRAVAHSHTRRETATEVHDRSEVRIGILVVTENVDAVAGSDHADIGRTEVVTDLEQDVVACRYFSVIV